jgi:hypothetical protein
MLLDLCMAYVLWGVHLVERSIHKVFAICEHKEKFESPEDLPQPHLPPKQVHLVSYGSQGCSGPGQNLAPVRTHKQADVGAFQCSEWLLSSFRAHTWCCINEFLRIMASSNSQVISHLGRLSKGRVVRTP